MLRCTIRMPRLSPVLKAALTSATIMSAGDLFCQGLRLSLGSKREGGTKPSIKTLLPKIDLDETMRFGLVGLSLHGPFFYSAFRWLDSTFPPRPGAAPTFRLALTKTLIGQVTVFPVYLVSFFTYMGFLEGLNVRECSEKVRRVVPSTFLYGTSWIGINLFNFWFVKPKWRVLYINIAGLFWNTVLAMQNATRGHVEHEIINRN